MRGRLTLQGLEQAVAEGAIDTVLVAQIDMQGRLMGKRFQAEFFLDERPPRDPQLQLPARHRLEMETVPGYKATSWAAGYGDYVMRPTSSTLRRVPGSRAPRWCSADVLDHHGHAEVPHSPRAILQPPDRPAARRWATAR